MKKLLIFMGFIAVFTTACTRQTILYNPAPRHDNGLHKGWYKNGKGMPPGQAKKMRRYGY